MTRLTCKEIYFNWDTECEKFVFRLKEKLTTAMLLIIPDPNGPYEVFCAASKTGLSGVFM